MRNPAPNLPLRKAMFDGGGTPDGQAAVKLLGNLTREWIGYLQAANGPWVMYGAAADRANIGTNSIPDGALFVETDSGLIYQWRVTDKAWSAAAGTQVLDVTLIAASTTIAAPATGAVDLVVILRQDVTGGRVVVWGAGFSAASAAIDTTASTISTFRFVLSGGKYVMVGQPTTGMTP